jgi:hypothetical protein
MRAATVRRQKAPPQIVGDMRRTLVKHRAAKTEAAQKARHTDTVGKHSSSVLPAGSGTCGSTWLPALATWDPWRTPKAWDRPFS